jgi:AraC-like DNA-binding protein/ligand-binding sensor protein
MSHPTSSSPATRRGGTRAPRRPTQHALELATGPELQALLDHFAACFAIRIAFFTPTGEQLQIGLRQPNCEFCQYLRQELKLEPRCRAQDREKFAEAAAARTLTAYSCHAGLREAIQAVRLADGTLAGFIMIGQFRLEGAAYSASLQAATRHRPAVRRELDRLFARVPAMSAVRLPHLLALFSLLVDTVSARHLVRLRGDLLLNRIEQLIQEKLDRPLSLAEAAQAVGRSPSTVSHLFTQRLGTSFKRAVLDAKMAAAEQLLRTVPGLTVTEAAARVGYPNPFHFSRIFRKIKGLPPSALKHH